MNKSICLIGFMGAGKSTIGKLLANKLNCTYLDLDSELELQESMSISDMVKIKGWTFFREKESTYFSNLNFQESKVVSVGGGFPLEINNWDFIRKATSIYLKVDPVVLFSRLKKEKLMRPLISDLSDKQLKEFIEIELENRREKYEQADVIISAHGTQIEVCAKIIDLIKIPSVT